MKKTALLIFTIVSCTFAKAQIQFGVKAGVGSAKNSVFQFGIFYMFGAGK